MKILHEQEEAKQVKNKKNEFQLIHKIWSDKRKSGEENRKAKDADNLSLNKSRESHHTMSKKMHSIAKRNSSNHGPKQQSENKFNHKEEDYEEEEMIMKGFNYFNNAIERKIRNLAYAAMSEEEIVIRNIVTGFFIYNLEMFVTNSTPSSYYYTATGPVAGPETSIEQFDVRLLNLIRLEFDNIKKSTYGEYRKTWWVDDPRRVFFAIFRKHFMKITQNCHVDVDAKTIHISHINHLSREEIMDKYMSNRFFMMQLMGNKFRNTRSERKSRQSSSPSSMWNFWRRIRQSRKGYEPLH